ncbi:alcohol dehydrogenase catalytic domain-containing protein [Paenibacillus sp. LjRoot56]
MLTLKKVKVKVVPDKAIQKSDDILVRITTTTICGSDLHLCNGEIPSIPKDFIIGPVGLPLLKLRGRGLGALFRMATARIISSD